MRQLGTLANQIATQDRLPKIREKIDRVGVSDLRVGVKLRNGGREETFLVLVDLFIDLDGERKGIHMSRLVESINEVVSS